MVELIVMVTRSLEWFGHVKRRQKTENIGAVAKTKDGNRKTEIEMKDDYQKGHESMEDEEGMDHRQGKRERYLQGPLPRTERNLYNNNNILFVHTRYN